MSTKAEFEHFDSHRDAIYSLIVSCEFEDDLSARNLYSLSREIGGFKSLH